MTASSTESTDPVSPVVAVTGASRGIGAETARVLAAGGARVVLGARDAAATEQVARQIGRAGGSAVHLAVDVTRPGDLHAMVDLAVDRFGRLDVLVANAGIAQTGPLADGRPEDWDAMIDVNLRGVLHGIAATLPVFRRQGTGHLVVVGSTSAIKWVPGQGVYAATKAAVRALVEVLRQELSPEGIRATLITPGMTHTDFVSTVRDPDERAAAIARRDAIAMPADAVARAIAYAIGQPPGVDVGEIVVRSTAQP